MHGDLSRDSVQYIWTTSTVMCLALTLEMCA